MSQQPRNQSVMTHDQAHQAILTGAPVTQGEPFQISMNNSPGQQGEFKNFSIAVPQGKMLVIQSASVRVMVPPGQEVMADLHVSGPPGLPIGFQYLVLERQGTFKGVDVFTGNHSLVLWAGFPGATFSVARSSTTGLMSVEISIVGFFGA